MKKLIARLGILTLCVAAFVLITSRAMSADSGNLADAYAAMPEKIQIANTGDSHGASGFHYGESDYSGFNFALGSQPVSYDYSLLDQYKERIEPGAVVLINLSYFTLWADDAAAAGRENRDLRYLQILDSAHMHYERPIDDLMNRYARILTFADRRIMTIFRPPQGDMMDEESLAESDLTIEEIGKRRAQYHMRHFVDAKGNRLPVNQSNIDYLNKILALCAERGWKPILTVTPYLDAYSKWFDPALLEEFAEAAKSCAAPYAAPFWDYSKDARFAFDETLFKDSDHLTGEGAKKFTAIVIEDLRRAGLI